MCHEYQLPWYHPTLGFIVVNLEQSHRAYIPYSNLERYSLLLATFQGLVCIPQLQYTQKGNTSQEYGRPTNVPGGPLFDLTEMNFIFDSFTSFKGLEYEKVNSYQLQLLKFLTLKI